MHQHRHDRPKRSLIERVSAPLASLLIPAMLLGQLGCGGTASNNDSAVSADEDLHRTMDGETLFRGIFFGVGPVAKALPEYWKAERSGSSAVKSSAEVIQNLTALSSFLRAKPGKTQSDLLQASEVDQWIELLKNGSVSVRDLARVGGGEAFLGSRLTTEYSAA